MNCLIVAGEKSGEEHGLSFLVKLQEFIPSLKFWGVGGDLFQERNVELIYHCNMFSSWGYSEVLFKIPFYWKAIKKLVTEAILRKTKIAILIDFQEFNLVLSKKLSKRGVKIFYYVAPQAWVWKSYRIKKIQKYVHTLFTILPFEKKWFEERGVRQIISVSHPLLHSYKNILKKWNLSENEYCKGKKLRILLLPGSRNFEVAFLLPSFIRTIQRLRQDRNVQVGIVKCPHVDENLYQPYEEECDESYMADDLVIPLQKYHFSIAASGTITLSLALFQIPSIICYRGTLLDYFIFEMISYKGFFSLTNIIHKKYIFPELIQDLGGSFNIYKNLIRWIEDPKRYQKVREELKETQSYLKGEDQDVAEYMGKIIIRSK